MSVKYNKIKAKNPLLLSDTTSSATTVYFRRYLGEEHVSSYKNGKHVSVTYHEYDEFRLPRKTYEAFQMNGTNLLDSMFKDSEQMRADLDYIAIMSGIDLEEGAV